MQKIKARITGSREELGAFETITVHGCELSREFTEHEVDDFVFGKLKGNRHVEVLVPKPVKVTAGGGGGNANAPVALTVGGENA